MLGRVGPCGGTIGLASGCRDGSARLSGLPLPPSNLSFLLSLSHWVGRPPQVPQQSFPARARHVSIARPRRRREKVCALGRMHGMAGRMP